MTIEGQEEERKKEQGRGVRKLEMWSHNTPSYTPPRKEFTMHRDVEYALGLFL